MLTLEKVRYNGQVRDIAVLKVIGVNSEGYREIHGVSCSISEAKIHWTRVARLFSNEESYCRLVTAICVEIHEEWMSGS
jgi:transposase-like protein